MLNETKIDQSDTLHVTGYTVICRHDRNANGGGVAVLCRNDRIAQVIKLEESTYERIWILVHTNDGPKLVCCWYRPPGENIEGIHAFRDELHRLRPQGVNTYVIGDLNVHNKRWLKFSSGRTKKKEGK